MRKYNLIKPIISFEEDCACGSMKAKEARKIKATFDTDCACGSMSAKKASKKAKDASMNKQTESKEIKRVFLTKKINQEVFDQDCACGSMNAKKVIKNAK